MPVPVVNRPSTQVQAASEPECHRVTADMVLSPKVEIRGSSIAGRGLFVVAPLAKGEWVWKEDPDEETKYWKTAAQVAELSEDDRRYFLNFAYIVRPGVYSGTASTACAAEL
jgi:hypothetical protein